MAGLHDQPSRVVTMEEHNQTLGCRWPASPQPRRPPRPPTAPPSPAPRPSGSAATRRGSRRWPLAGWTFDDAAHEAWTTDPALRFLDDAFTRAEPDRTTLHSRALLAVNLLSQGWLSWNPDVELLNSAMALEVLLGEAQRPG